MADLSGINLDPNVKESGDFEVVPEGKYPVVIINDELKDTKAGTGKYLEITLQINKGEYRGTELTDRLNIQNPSGEAVRIGQGTLKRICSVCNVPFPIQDTRKLYGRPMTAKVKIKEFQSNTTGNLLQSNEVSSYSRPMNDYKPVKQVTQETIAESSDDIPF